MSEFYKDTLIEKVPNIYRKKDGWVVRVERNRVVKYGSARDKDYHNSKLLSFGRAARIKERLIKEMGESQKSVDPIHTLKARLMQQRSVSITGVHGIGFILAKGKTKLEPRILVTYYVNGKRRQKSYSINKWGFNLSLVWACKDNMDNRRNGFAAKNKDLILYNPHQSAESMYNVAKRNLSCHLRSIGESWVLKCKARL